MYLIFTRGKAKKHVFGSSGGCRGGWLPNSCLRIGYHGIVHKILNLTARQLREFALLAQPAGFLSRLLAGNCPGGKPVWRNICHHGARGLLCYRGTKRIVIR